MLVGAAAGDALGWAQEPRGGLVGGKRARAARQPRAAFTTWERSNGSRYQRYREQVLPGEYSDDTQLMLAVARACLRGNRWVSHLTQVELPSWPLYQRGGGRAILRAAASWREGRAPWDAAGTPTRIEDYRQAGANGVAMRIAPHVAYALARPDEELLTRVLLDGLATHGHPRALVAAVSLAGALRFALTVGEVVDTFDLIDAAQNSVVPGSVAVSLLPSGWLDADADANAVAQSKPDTRRQFSDLWEQTNREMSDLLAVAARSLRRGSMSNIAETLDALGATGRLGGAGTVSVASALYLASRAGTRPESGVIQAAFHPEIDTDTIASMTGALAGALHGTSWLGALAAVQDASYLKDLAMQLLEKHPIEPSNVRVPNERHVIADLDAGRPEGTFADGRKYQTSEIEEISEQPWVVRHRLFLEDGQSVVVDRVRREKRVISTARPPARVDSVDTDVVVTLPTRDLDATRAFYEKIIRQEIPREESRVRVLKSLIFVPIRSAPLFTADARIRLMVSADNLARLRAEYAPQAEASSPSMLVLTDPDDRPVTIALRHPDS